MEISIDPRGAHEVLSRVESVVERCDAAATEIATEIAGLASALRPSGAAVTVQAARLHGVVTESAAEARREAADVVEAINSGLNDFMGYERHVVSTIDGLTARLARATS